MASVTSYTKQKIDELLAGWSDIVLSQEEINAMIAQISAQVAASNAALLDLNNNVLPALETDLAANSVLVQELNETTLVDLQMELTQASADISVLNTVTLPSLQSQISSNYDWINELNTVTLPQLQTDLDSAAADISTLNSTTLPALDTRLASAETSVSSISAKFPIKAADIFANTITANQIAAHTITAVEIAAGTITASEIAANTITANKIAAGTITANEIAAATITGSKIAAGTITASNIAAGTITANEIAAGTITALNILSGTITATQISTKAITADKIDAGAITAGKISAGAVTAGTLGVGAVTAGTIAAGAVTAGTIDADAVTANNILAGTITATEINVQDVAAGVVNAGVIQSSLTITGTLSILGTNMGWSAQEGLYLGNGTRFFADSRTNKIAGDLDANSVSISSYLTLGGATDNQGDFTVANGISTPTVSLSLADSWPSFISYGLGDGYSDYSENNHDFIDYDSTTWLVATNKTYTTANGRPTASSDAGFAKISKSDGSFISYLTVGSWANRFHPQGGLCKIGTDLYTLGYDEDRSKNYYIYRISSTGSFLSEIYFDSYSNLGLKKMRLVTDGTRVGVVWTGGAGNLKLRWYTSSLSAQSGSDITLISGFGDADIGGAHYGIGSPGGTTRLWVSVMRGGDGRKIRCFTTSGTAVTSEDFLRPNWNSLCGLAYDSTSGYMYSYDKTGYIYKYSNYVNAGILNAQYTWYDGDSTNGTHETSPSPVTSYNMLSRAWPSITAPAPPDAGVTDVTKTDKANRIGIYASFGTGVATSLQSYLDVGVQTLSNFTLNTTSAVAGSSGVASFASSATAYPGTFSSAAKDGTGSSFYRLVGDGSGRMGHIRWDSTGKPLNFGSYASTTTQSGAFGVTTPSARTGFVVRNASAPSNGISYNDSTGTFTISQSGLWYLQTTLGFENPSTSQTIGRRGTIIRVNSVDTFRTDMQAPTATAVTTSISASGVTYLAAGSTIQVFGYQNTGANLNYLSTADTSNFSAYCLAAF